MFVGEEIMYMMWGAEEGFLTIMHVSIIMIASKREVGE